MLIKQPVIEVRIEQKVYNKVMDMLIFDHKNHIQDIYVYTNIDTIDNNDMTFLPIKNNKHRQENVSQLNLFNHIVIFWFRRRTITTTYNCRLLITNVWFVRNTSIRINDHNLISRSIIHWNSIHLEYCGRTNVANKQRLCLSICFNTFLFFSFFKRSSTPQVFVS